MRTNRFSMGSARAQGGWARSGFTLIEMLAVIAIMGLMMAVTVGGFLHWGRNSAMRGAVMNVRAGLGMARQYAITHRAVTAFSFGNSRGEMDVDTGWYTITATNALIGTTNFLPKGIAFTNDPSQNTMFDGGQISFNFDGSCVGQAVSATTNIVIMNRHVGLNLTATTVVYKLTGRFKCLVWGEQ
jgi:prepilin-type N-terminal cleavage/methylation domain-containing protein